MSKISKRQTELFGSEAAVPADSLETEAAQAASAHGLEEIVAGSAVPPEPVDQPPASLEGKTVWVIDSMSLIFQVFHAIPEMTSPRGEPVAAVFGFTRDLFNLIEQKKPDYLFCAFDLSGPTFRHELAGDYKGHRPDMPVDLSPQIGQIRRVVEALGIPLLEHPNYEADDVMATVARLVCEHGGQCVLVTSDKDCRQLINSCVRLYNVRKGEFFDEAKLLDDWGIRPDQVVDYQSLVGDPVDNVPGVPLIGPKIARELLTKYGTLDNLLDKASELPAGKRRDNLINGREQATISRQLVRLDAHVPVAIDWSSGVISRADAQALKDLFVDFGFHSLANKAAAMLTRTPPPVVAVDATFTLVDTAEKLATLATSLAAEAVFALHVLSLTEHPRDAAPLGIALAWGNDSAAYLPFVAGSGSATLTHAAVVESLRPVFESAAIAKVGHDLKHDLLALRNLDVRLAGLEFDTMIAGYLLDAGERNHTLEELSKRILNFQPLLLEELTGQGRNKLSLDALPAAQLGHYASQRATLAWRLRNQLRQSLDADELQPLYRDVELPLTEVLAELEFTGTKIDTELLGRLSERFGAKMDTLESEIYNLAGRPFNIGSPKQLGEILFQDLKLPVLKKTKTGASTDAEVLEELAAQHPLPAKIIEYRQYSKLKNTYVDALPTMVSPATGRIHTRFNQVVAATGRLSSVDPNLQNIPIRHEAGREIRSAFLAGHEGWSLLAADYSQIELRVLAHYSGDEALQDAFARDEDIHTRVASEVFAVEPDAVTSEMRRVAKAVNFGVIYGQSPFGLAKMLGISQEEAARFISVYFDGYPGVERFLESVLDDAARDGFVRTILGRRRAIRGIRTRPAQGTLPGSHDPWRQRNLAERTAINTVIQGSAADIIKLAMLRIQARLAEANIRSRMLLQIHDELMFEVSPEELDLVRQLVVDEMSGVMKLAVPLKVDVGVGASWADC